MRALVMIATVVVASSALAQSKRVTRTVSTGQAAVLSRTLSSCSVPDLIPPKYQISSFQSTSSSFAYKVCKEFATYEADVTGNSWNTKDTEVPGTRRLSYRVETVTKSASVTVPTYEVTDRDGNRRYSVSDANWALGNTQVILECNNSRLAFENNGVDVSETPCAR